MSTGYGGEEDSQHGEKDVAARRHVARFVGGMAQG